jgi:NADPH:quinone reductase-like Zn-dependent oxidoreductase
MESVRVRAGDVVAVSAAAGGVGSLAVQLAAGRGAEVIGIAGPRNVEWLESMGVKAVVYGDGLSERIRAIAPRGLDAFIDCFGGGYVDLAVELGVAPERIDTIIDRAGAHRHGAKAEGMSTVTDPGAVIKALAEAIAEGELVVPIARTFPLEEVRQAYTELEQRHTRGKIVLVVRTPPS